MKNILIHLTNKCLLSTYHLLGIALVITLLADKEVEVYRSVRAGMGTYMICSLRAEYCITSHSEVF